MPLPRLYPVAEAAAALGLPPALLEAAIGAGDLGHLTLAGAIYLTEDQVTAWLTANTVPPAAPASPCPQPAATPMPPAVAGLLPAPGWSGSKAGPAGTSAGPSMAGQRNAAQLAQTAHKLIASSSSSTRRPGRSARKTPTPDPRQLDLLSTLNS